MSNIQILKTSITDLKVDVIVNAANQLLLPGGGVCGAIFRTAGPIRLALACAKIGGCKTGYAVITPGFKLQAKYLIHTVGPRWKGGNQNEQNLLYSAYIESLKLAKENDCHSIGFPLISSGIYSYPKDKAWITALKACKDFIDCNSEYDIQIVFSVIDDELLSLGEIELCRRIVSEISNGCSYDLDMIVNKVISITYSIGGAFDEETLRAVAKTVVSSIKNMSNDGYI